MPSLNEEEHTTVFISIKTINSPARINVIQLDSKILLEQRLIS
jgi:hypothetical protein